MDENSCILAVYRLRRIIYDPKHAEEAVELATKLLRYDNLAKLVTRHHDKWCPIRNFIENKAVDSKLSCQTNMIFLLAILEYRPSDNIYYARLIYDFKKSRPNYFAKHDNILLTCDKEEAVLIIKNNDLLIHMLMDLVRRLDLTDNKDVVDHIMEKELYTNRGIFKYLMSVTCVKYPHNITDVGFHKYVLGRRPKSVFMIDVDVNILKESMDPAKAIIETYNKVHPQTCYRLLMLYDNVKFSVGTLTQIALDLKFNDAEDEPHEGIKYPYVPGSNHSILIRDFLKNKMHGRKLIIGRNNWLKRAELEEAVE